MMAAKLLGKYSVVKNTDSYAEMLQHPQNKEYILS
jgi:hypothetical protein